MADPPETTTASNVVNYLKKESVGSTNRAIDRCKSNGISLKKIMRYQLKSLVIPISNLRTVIQ